MILKIILFTYAITILISKCSGYDEYLKSDNINKFIFDEQNFKFIDLTMSLNKQYAKLSDDERTRVRTRHNQQNWVDFCEKDWIGTTLDLKLKSDLLHFGPQSDKKESYSKKRPKLNVDDIPLERLIVPLIIVDISKIVNSDQNFILKKHHLDFFLNNYFGNTAQPCIIIFKFGWSYKYDIRRHYGLIDNTTSVIPGISEEVATWITTAYKNVIGVGVDLPSVDSDPYVYVTHNTLVGAGLYVVTNVDIEEYIPDAWCTALLLPQAGQGSTAPVRFIAICPKSRMERKETPFHRL